MNEKARVRLLEVESFRDEFELQEPRASYVMSIDVRRSTELMLKAREPRLFAHFIIGLASKLRQVILERYGVFDKFTGDGILAFFPEFYSGPDAGYRVLDAAAACHATFQSHYQDNWDSFNAVLKSTGLGIGIDYGLVHLVRVENELTVVGVPVVYACRLGGGEAKHTYVNRTAYRQLFDKYSAYCDLQETEIKFKNEGDMVAYRARLNEKPFEPKPAAWEGQLAAQSATAARSPAASAISAPEKIAGAEPLTLVEGANSKMPAK